MIARRKPLHPLAVYYWLWRGQLVVNGSPDYREAARYRALRDLMVAFVGYVLSIVAFAYAVGEQEQLWTQVKQVLLNK